MVKRKLYFTRDTLSSDKKKSKKFRVKTSILLMKLRRQTSFKMAFVSLIILLILSVISLTLTASTENIAIEDFFIAFIALSISLFSTLIVLIKDIINSITEFNGSFIIENSETKSKIMKNVSSTEEYKKKGYEWKDYNGENKYETSDVINKFLVSTNFSEHKKNLKLALKDTQKKFIIPTESLRALDHRAKESFQKNEILFNSNLIRLSNDILNINGETLYLGKTDFFSHVSTNYCLYDSIRKYNDVDYQYDGYRFALKSSDIKNLDSIEFNNLKDSYCANSIGMSTLAVTKDGKIVVLIQGKTNESRGRLVPSGSGSAEYSTLKKNYGDKNSFVDFITYEMSREMLEEVQISKENYRKILKTNPSELTYVKNNKLDDINIKEVYDINNYHHKTYLIGYCRFLHRSGKPDFYGITKLDVDSSILKDYFNAYVQRVKSDEEKNETENAFFIGKLNVDSPYESLLKQTSDNVISLQLKYIIDELVKIKKNPSDYLDYNDKEKEEQKEFLELVNSFFE